MARKQQHVVYDLEYEKPLVVVQEEDVNDTIRNLESAFPGSSYRHAPVDSATAEELNEHIQASYDTLDDIFRGAR